MNCSKCQHKGVIELQHGALCKIHFIEQFEKKVFKTINKFQLLSRDDIVCVAASGGKDSLTVLYLLQKYMKENQFDLSKLQALVVDEGIANYREHTLVDLETFCQEHQITLNKVSFKKEFGSTLDQAFPILNKETAKKPCSICGVWRRTLLNRYAKKLGATKLVTGHNLDDEAQAIIMNIFKANTSLAARLGPKTGIKEEQGFVQRIKPLYLCSEQETRLYCFLKGWKIEFTECPNVVQSYRAQVRDFLNDFEAKFAGTKSGIINSFLDILPLLKERELQKAGTKTHSNNAQSMRYCSRCNEPSRHELCNACKLHKKLEELTQ